MCEVNSRCSAPPRGLGRRRRVGALVSSFVASMTVGFVIHASPKDQPKIAGDTCLTWNVIAEPGCPNVTELENAVELVLSQPIFSGERCDMKVEGSLQRSPVGSWTADLRFLSKDGRILGERHLTSLSPLCSSLRGPTALVIGLMVESVQTRTFERETTATEALPATGALPAIVRREPTFHLMATTDLRTAMGLLPGASVGATLGLGAMVRNWGAGRFEGTVWLPKSKMNSRYGGQFWGFHFGATLCPRLGKTGAVSWAACVGGVWGLLQGRGLDLDDNESVYRPYGHGEVRVAATLLLSGSLALTAHLGVASPWIRSRFVFLDSENVAHEAYRPSAAIPFAGLGFEWRLTKADRSDPKPSPSL
jgi:hypothetical protein